jgi:hypothetical protein
MLAEFLQDIAQIARFGSQVKDPVVFEKMKARIALRKGLMILRVHRPASNDAAVRVACVTIRL